MPKDMLVELAAISCDVLNNSHKKRELHGRNLRITKCQKNRDIEVRQDSFFNKAFTTRKMINFEVPQE